ncbi:hypothetical protein BSKO_11362 [Bryopsis sp. KO-2023]|nr:hypothetical protein BSKO_11362 [Bryopsis sp. KO-2023]
MVSRKSRKGKKAWRKNISDDKEVEGIKRSNERAEVAALKDAELFQLDTSRDDRTADAVIQGARKAAESVPLVVKKYSVLKAIKESKRQQWLEALKKKELEMPRKKVPIRKTTKRKPNAGVRYVDPWVEEKISGEEDGWNVPRSTKDLRPGNGHRKRIARALRRTDSKKTAVSIDEPGCSYNPEYVQHQASLGEAVAVEQAKEIKKAMAPKLLDGFDPTAVADEPDMIMVDSGGSDMEEEDLDEPGEPVPIRKPTTTEKRKSKADRNRELRVKKMEKELSSRRKTERMLKQINNVKAIVKEIEGEEQLSANMQKRRQIDRLIKSKIVPPTLGKYKYRAASLPVLCSDEVTGSLRKLKPAVMLCKDLTKGYERVGAVEAAPSHIVKKQAPKGVEFRTGQRTERMTEVMEDFRTLNTRVKDLQKQLHTQKKASG